MAAYADYTFYLNTYHGSAIAFPNFERLALKASTFIDQSTFGRAAGVTDEAKITLIKMATCAVAEELQQLQESGGVVQSERVGNVSVTYFSAKSANARLSDAAKPYLWDTDLMYRGLNENE